MLSLLLSPQFASRWIESAPWHLRRTRSPSAVRRVGTPAPQLTSGRRSSGRWSPFPKARSRLPTRPTSKATTRAEGGLRHLFPAALDTRHPNSAQTRNVRAEGRPGSHRLSSDKTQPARERIELANRIPSWAALPLSAPRFARSAAATPALFAEEQAYRRATRHSAL